MVFFLLSSCTVYLHNGQYHTILETVDGKDIVERLDEDTGVLDSEKISLTCGMELTFLWDYLIISRDWNEYTLRTLQSDQTKPFFLSQGKNEMLSGQLKETWQPDDECSMAYQATVTGEVLGAFTADVIKEVTLTPQENCEMWAVEPCSWTETWFFDHIHPYPE